MSSPKLYSLWNARLGEEERKFNVYSTPVCSQLLMPALPLLSLILGSNSPKSVPAAKMPNMLQLICIHHTTRRRQNRAGEWFLLLFSHKTVQAERERKSSWIEVPRAALLRTACLAAVQHMGKIFPVRVQSYWTLIILSHISICLLGPKISHFKSISYLSEKLGLHTFLLKLWPG